MYNDPSAIDGNKSFLIGSMHRMLFHVALYSRHMEWPPSGRSGVCGARVHLPISCGSLSSWALVLSLMLVIGSVENNWLDTELDDGLVDRPIVVSVLFFVTVDGRGNWIINISGPARDENWPKSTSLTIRGILEEDLFQSPATNVNFVCGLCRCSVPCPLPSKIQLEIIPFIVHFMAGLFQSVLVFSCLLPFFTTMRVWWFV